MFKKLSDKRKAEQENEMAILALVLFIAAYLTACYFQ
jgi:hypothetical protein